MGVRCDCGKAVEEGVRHYHRGEEPIWPAVVLGFQVLRQRLRLAWLRMRTRSRRQLSGSADPYRSLGPLPRFELRVGEDVLESESFGGIIAQMRALGCSDEEIIEAAIVTHNMPRGGTARRQRVSHMQQVDDTLKKLLAGHIANEGANEGAFARRIRERDSPPAPSPRVYWD